MNVNLSTSLSLRYGVIVAVALLSSAAVVFFPVAAQTPASEAEEWEVLRTPYGHPDL